MTAKLPGRNTLPNTSTKLSATDCACICNKVAGSLRVVALGWLDMAQARSEFKERAHLLEARLVLLRSAKLAIRPSTPLALTSAANWVR